MSSSHDNTPINESPAEEGDGNHSLLSNINESSVVAGDSVVSTGRDVDAQPARNTTSTSSKPDDCSEPSNLCPTNYQRRGSSRENGEDEEDDGARETKEESNVKEQEKQPNAMSSIEEVIRRVYREESALEEVRQEERHERWLGRVSDELRKQRVEVDVRFRDVESRFQELSQMMGGLQQQVDGVVEKVPVIVEQQVCECFDQHMGNQGPSLIEERTVRDLPKLHVREEQGTTRGERPKLRGAAEEHEPLDATTPEAMEVARRKGMLEITDDDQEAAAREGMRIALWKDDQRGVWTETGVRKDDVVCTMQLTPLSVTSRVAYEVVDCDGVVHDGQAKKGLAKFLNYSCEPNGRRVVWTMNGQHWVGYQALENVPPKSWLTVSHGRTLGENEEPTACMCGSSKCRGMIQLTEGENEQQQTQPPQQQPMREPEWQEVVSQRQRREARKRGQLNSPTCSSSSLEKRVGRISLQQLRGGKLERRSSGVTTRKKPRVSEGEHDHRERRENTSGEEAWSSSEGDEERRLSAQENRARSRRSTRGGEYDSNHPSSRKSILRKSRISFGADTVLKSGLFASATPFKGHRGAGAGAGGGGDDSSSSSSESSSGGGSSNRSYSSHHHSSSNSSSGSDSSVSTGKRSRKRGGRKRSKRSKRRKRGGQSGAGQRLAKVNIQGLPRWSGNEEEQTAHEWLASYEGHIRAMGYTGGQAVDVAGLLYDLTTVQQWHQQQVGKLDEAGVVDDARRWRRYRRAFVNEYTRRESVRDRVSERFRHLKRREGESLVDYRERYVKLCTELERQYAPLRPTPNWARDSLKQFINGLSYEQNTAMLMMRPKTVDEAMTHLWKLETARESAVERQDVPLKQGVRASRGRGATVAAMSECEGVDEGSSGAGANDLLGVMGQLVAEMAHMRVANQRGRERSWSGGRGGGSGGGGGNGGGSSWGGGQGRSPSRVGHGSGSGGGSNTGDTNAGNKTWGAARCYRCKKEGHMIRDCPEPPGPRKCERCNDPGHWEHQCSYVYESLHCSYCDKTGHVEGACKKRQRDGVPEKYPRTNGGGHPGGSGGGAGAPPGGGGGGGQSQGGAAQPPSQDC